MLPEIAAELQGNGVAKETQCAALGVFLAGYKTKEGEPLPLLVRKSDGGYLYDDDGSMAQRAGQRPNAAWPAADLVVTDARKA